MNRIRARNFDYRLQGFCMLWFTIYYLRIIASIARYVINITAETYAASHQSMKKQTSFVCDSMFLSTDTACVTNFIYFINDNFVYATNTGKHDVSLHYRFQIYTTNFGFC